MENWWFQEDPSYDNEKYGIEWLARLHKSYNEHKTGVNGNPIHLFFSSALLPYYDPCGDGANGTCLDLLYRLSDRIEEDERRNILIYPEKDGEIYDSEGDCQWNSLEDWRKEYFKQRIREGPIPELRKLIETNKELEEIIS